MENAFDNVIHVTGFGVFRGFADTNPSWEAVSRLPEAVEINNKRFAIVKHEVPVTYADVNEKIKDIWTQKPKLVVHCGAHAKATKICLEQNAFNGNFNQTDFAGNKLDCCHVELPNAGGECKQLCTALDLDGIVEKVEDVMRSDHPGDYLCGFMYLKSLDIDSTRSLFIHVPRPCAKFTVDVIRDRIFCVIVECIKQLDAK